MKRLFTLSVCCAALACVFALQMSARTQVQSQADEEVTIKLRGLDGKMYDISSMRGNVLLVSFGATWCVPCKEELTILEELRREYAEKPVKFLWVSLDPEDELSDKDLRAYVKQRKVTFPVLRDTTKFTYAQFSTRVRLPLVVFFDKDGRLATPNQFGMTATPELYKTRVRERLDKLLAMQAQSNAAGAQ